MVVNLHVGEGEVVVAEDKFGDDEAVVVEAEDGDGEARVVEAGSTEAGVVVLAIGFHDGGEEGASRCRRIRAEVLVEARETAIVGQELRRRRRFPSGERTKERDERMDGCVCMLCTTVVGPDEQQWNTKVQK